MPSGRGVAGGTKSGHTLAVRISHPAATHRTVYQYLLMSSFTDYCKGGIFMNFFQKQKKLFLESLHELKDAKTLAATAMLIAVAVVLGFYSLQLTDYIKIGFAFIADELTGMLFGPVAGGLMGTIADLVKYVVRPTGPFFPGFTINGLVGGLIYGMVLYKRPLSLKRVILANGLITVIVNICMTTYWLTLLYGSAFFAILPARIVKEAVMFPISAALFYTVAKVLSKANVFTILRSKANETAR